MEEVYKAFIESDVFVLLMTAGGNDFTIPLEWYANFEKWFPWKNIGTVLGTGKTKEARILGESIR